MNANDLVLNSAATMPSQYHNLGSLQALKAEARNNPEAALEKVAEQFEAVFIKMMLSSMRDALPKEGLFDNNQMDTYTEMMDQQMSVKLAEQGGIGLAEVISRQLKMQQPPISNAGRAAFKLDNSQQQWHEIKQRQSLTHQNR
jgi:flagellar protein FlgJ